MATPILMPKQGQSVETCLILEWKKQVGDAVAEGDVLCEVETDKATFEVEATAAGTLIATFYDEGDDVGVGNKRESPVVRLDFAALLIVFVVLL